jgi:hypothetical protein
MYFFIVLNIVLCVFEQQARLIIAPIAIEICYFVLFLALLCLVIVSIKKEESVLWSDVFSSLVLIVWLIYWRSLFKDDSIIFFFFPLYFFSMHTDVDTLRYMASIKSSILFKPWIIMLGVLISLSLDDNYLLFPVLMTLLLIRLKFSIYLNSVSC